MIAHLDCPYFDIRVVVGPCVDGTYFHRTFNGLLLLKYSKINAYLGDVVGEIFSYRETSCCG
jgi:hypothetical protein